MNEEHHNAVAFSFWWAHTAALFGVSEKLLWAIPNGGKRGIRTAMKMKAEGVRRGAPDYILMIPRNGFHGLAIELKRPKTSTTRKGSVSPEQKEMLELLSKEGYDVAVCYGSDDAIKKIHQYLGEKK